ncbi:unnamed protein product [Dovyalis caffra]|uniref:WAT1-related protein n=1 Tax=Dovyalis caffra TaxID=77055 RepID=A0AAV1SUW8_9ROSI|nr:unnamed protein product [Dovyalis caffra]
MARKRTIDTQSMMCEGPGKKTGREAFMKGIVIDFAGTRYFKMVWYKKKQILEDLMIIGGLEQMAKGIQFQVVDSDGFNLFWRGIELTSPAMATAMPNLAPGLIFIIAWSLRLEKVKLSCVYSKVKIVGTLLCVVGAIIMSLMSSTESAKESKFSSTTPAADMAATLGDFPAPMSLCAITSLIGVVITAIVELIQNHKVDIGWPLMKLGDLVCYSVLGGAVGGVCVSFNGWAMKKRGPVLVSVFNPIGTVISVVFSVITLGDRINLGRYAGQNQFLIMSYDNLAGMFLMFTGLYFVLWAKGKEGFPDGDHLESEFDPQKPLLA